MALAAAREQFTRELEWQRTAGVAAEERHAAYVMRALLDVSCERVHGAKLQKELEQSLPQWLAVYLDTERLRRNRGTRNYSPTCTASCPIRKTIKSSPTKSGPP